MQRERKIGATVMATLLVVSIVGVVSVLGGGAGLASAVHPEDATDVTENSNFTVVLPHTTDHHPGDINEENGSIQYFAQGAEAFDELGAEEGVFIDWIIVHAEYEGEDWIDYSACDTENTEVFGIDRGNNNSGNQVDDDLLDRQASNDFRDDGIVIEFFDWDDFANDPPYLSPEDAVVAAQGQGSAGGACLTMTDEPGWYRIAAFMNATVADNGPDQEPSDDADYIEIELSSNYLYVCDCDDEQEAREQLGDPPNEQDSDSTPTPEPEQDDQTPTPTPTPEPEQDDQTPTPTPTPEPEQDDQTPTPTPTPEPEHDDDDQQDEQQEQQEAEGDDIGQTPTPGDGPGFGALAALGALLAGALLARRT